MRLHTFVLISITMVAAVSCSTQKSTQTAPKPAETAKKETAPKPVHDQKVLITTDYGDMVVKLYDATPQHRDNFIKLVKQGFYDSLMFHRVIKNFMIQGGDPESKHAQPGVMLGNGDVGYTVPAEFVDTLFHKKGALCAARQGDQVNPAKASSGCQFYIVQGQVLPPEQIAQLEQRTGRKMTDAQKQAYSTVGGTPFLDHNYTVYGEVISGMDVIDKIAAVKTAPGDRPVQDVRMKMKLID
jgi:cyclophilin family peptidyl-prolyl cis-trans isomerase